MGSPVKIKRYPCAARAGSCVAVGLYTVYMRVPSQLYRVLRDKYNIDIRNPDELFIEAWLAEEVIEDIPNSSPEVALVYKFRKLGGI